MFAFFFYLQHARTKELVTKKKKVQGVGCLLDLLMAVFLLLMLYCTKRVVALVFNYQLVARCSSPHITVLTVTLYHLLLRIS